MLTIWTKLCKRCNTEFTNERKTSKVNSLVLSKSRFFKKEFCSYTCSARSRSLLWSDPEHLRRAKKAKNWVKRNPEKANAHYILNYNVRKGRVIKPTVCSSCGTKGPLDAHHEDYSKPLEVIWLCRPCHKEK